MVTFKGINPQVLHLGMQEAVTHEEGGTTVEADTRAEPFESFRLKPLLDRLAKEGVSRRLWEKDGSLWSNDPSTRESIRRSLGWLEVAGRMKERVGEINEFVNEVKMAGFSHVVHMGMGGSSLAPLVYQSFIKQTAAGLSLIVLDTTDPFTVSEVERKVDLEKTLFIVASKSGTTAEPQAFGDYFFMRVRAVKGEKAGENFAAITDPGTVLARQAEERSYRQTFINFEDIGGRYSALSYFGLVPAALMGGDLDALLDHAIRMFDFCGPTASETVNPAVVLGTIMGEMARIGRDKITFLLSSDIESLGMWLEQLIAESTGKEGTGILPVTGEAIGTPSVYGNDRLFVHISREDSIDSEMEKRLQALRAAGLPLISIEIGGDGAIAQEFVRWEIAVAVAGALLGINPFDQPNVQEAKDATNRFLKDVETRGSLVEPSATMIHGSLSFFTGETSGSPERLLRNFFSLIPSGGYVSLQAYLPEEAETNSMLESVRVCLRDSLRIATTVGYAPRLLHSTGQLHKGGPDTGLFLQLTARDTIDISIPGKSYTFGIFKHAQALGDFEALRRHGRSVIRIDLGDDVKGGLAQLKQLIDRVLTEGAGG
jgi:glucose-6-phosphate isomerase